MSGDCNAGPMYSQPVTVLAKLLWLTSDSDGYPADAYGFGWISVGYQPELN